MGRSGKLPGGGGLRRLSSGGEREGPSRELHEQESESVASIGSVLLGAGTESLLDKIQELINGLSKMVVE